MKLIRYIVRLYLSRFPITEGKKYIYVFAKKYLLPSRSNINSRTKHGFYLKLNLKNPEHQYYYLTQVNSIFNNGRNILFCKPESKYSKRIENILYE
jgi:hypothetical protein